MAQKPLFWPILPMVSKNACFLTSLIFRFHKKTKKHGNSYLNHFQQLLFHTFPPSDEAHFYGLSADAAYLKNWFPTEEQSKSQFFASFTCLCNSNLDPAQALWNQNTWINKQANPLVFFYWTLSLEKKLENT